MQRPANRSGYHDRQRPFRTRGRWLHARRETLVAKIPLFCLILVSCWAQTLALLPAAPFLSAAETAGIALWISDDPSADLISEDLSRLPSWFLPDDGLSVDEALFQEQPLRTVPRVAPAPTWLPAAADELTTDLFASGWGVRRSVLPEERWTQPVGSVASPAVCSSCRRPDSRSATCAATGGSPSVC